MTKETKTELCKNVKVEGKEEEDEWDNIKGKSNMIDYFQEYL